MINPRDFQFGNLLKDERGTTWEFEYWDPTKTYVNLRRKTSTGTLYTCKDFESLFSIPILMSWVAEEFYESGKRYYLRDSNIALVDSGDGEFGVEVKGCCITYTKFQHQLQNIFKILTNNFLDLNYKNE